MALDRDELNKRREQREQLRQKRLREQRRLKWMLLAAAVILVLCGIGIYFIARSSGNTKAAAPSQDSAVEAAALQTGASSEATEATEATESVRSKRNPVTTIHIKAAGDLNVTNSVIQAGLSATGYDYTRAFLDVANVLSEADLTVLNFEGNICGEPYGTATTSAPREILEGLRNAGVDLLQMANSCSINNGLIGLNSTLTAVRSAGLEPLGAYASPAAFKTAKGYTICQVQGIKVAFVAFTKGVGGMGMPAGNEDCVNLLYTDYDSTYKDVDTDGITKILNSVAAEKPDITIALLHWGSEYNDEISSTQEKIVTLMKKRGVDVIIGTHPHTLQEIDFDESTGTLVAYSLGDFFGDASRGGTNYSIILDLEITKDSDAGTTKVTGYSYTPIYTMTEDEGDGYRRVIRINEAMAAYEGNYVDKVTKTAYDNMAYALTRIEDRINGKYK